MDPLSELDQRIDQLCALAARPCPDAALVEEINDVLSEGYAHALRVEQDLVALDEQLVELMLSGDPDRAREVALVDARRRALGRGAARLREQLDRMHHYFVVLTAR